MGCDDYYRYEPPRHPAPLESMGFQRVSSMDCHGQYYHKPCRQMFFVGWSTGKVPDEIYHHANHCPLEKPAICQLCNHETELHVIHADWFGGRKNVRACSYNMGQGDPCGCGE